MAETIKKTPKKDKPVEIYDKKGIIKDVLPVLGGAVAGGGIGRAIGRLASEIKTTGAMRQRALGHLLRDYFRGAVRGKNLYAIRSAIRSRLQAVKPTSRAYRGIRATLAKLGLIGHPGSIKQITARIGK